MHQRVQLFFALVTDLAILFVHRCSAQGTGKWKARFVSIIHARGRYSCFYFYRFEVNDFFSLYTDAQTLHYTALK